MDDLPEYLLISTNRCRLAKFEAELDRSCLPCDLEASELSDNDNSTTSRKFKLCGAVVSRDGSYSVYLLRGQWLEFNLVDNQILKVDMPQLMHLTTEMLLYS